MKERAYALVTIPRKKDYLGQTIKKLEATGFFDRTENRPLHLVAACPDNSHLKPYRKDPRFEIHLLTHGESVMWTQLGTKQRCAFGHYITMRRMLEQPWDELLVLEDDVMVAGGWQDYLEKVVPDIRYAAFSDGRWILSLYNFSVLGLKLSFMTGKRFEEIQSHNFWGTQGTLYPRSIVEELNSHILHNCLETTKQTIDVSIAAFAKESHVRLFTIVPSIIQHIGDETTGQSAHFHTATVFFDPVREPRVSVEKS